MRPINYLDGFSGYGGFHLGLERAGFEFDFVYYSEIDKHAIANYRYNFPQSLYAGSIDTICTGGIVKDIDLFTFGYPCQDNSIAGKRKGQRTGTRSGLLFESVKIIEHYKPRAFIAENVLGLLSVNAGFDIIESLEVLAYLNESCPQYDIEMQLLNTRWFLPQNRERLYFIGRLRGSGIGEVFPLGETGISHVKESGYTKEGVACTLGTRSAKARLGADYTIIKVKSGTKCGYEEAVPGDSINTTYINSDTRKGRVGKGVSQTLQTSVTQCVYIDGDRFRDFTPLEYERLQGLPEAWTMIGNYDGELKLISDTQRYKLCGNGVSVPVVEAIGRKILEQWK